MKIKEEIKKSGEFWLPTATERKVQGTLSISNDGGIELEIFQPFENNIEKIFSRNLDSLNRVVGHVQDCGYVTLDDCQYKTRTHNMVQDVLKVHSILWASRVFTGVEYRANEKPRFNTFTFSIEGIDEWIGANSIKVEHDPEKRITIILYQHLESIILNLDDDMHLENYGRCRTQWVLKS